MKNLIWNIKAMLKICGTIILYFLYAFMAKKAANA